MYTFRMREYKTPANPNCFDYKIEVTTEHRASEFAHIETEWIYFQAELNT